MGDCDAFGKQFGLGTLGYETLFLSRMGAHLSSFVLVNCCRVLVGYLIMI